MNGKGKNARRPSLQFTLRTFFVLVLIFGVLLAWRVNRAKQQELAVAYVREFGGSVLYDYELEENQTANVNFEPPVLPWLVDLFGIDFFYDVRCVNLTNTKILDLAPLQGLKRLQRLRLAYTDVADLIPLSSLTDMTNLDLDGTEVSDLSPLKDMTQLRRLILDNTPVSDLKPLAKLTRLEGLYCRRTPVSDLSPLKSNTNIQSLNLTGSNVSEISALVGMTRIQKLDLRATAISDLSPLAGQANLRHLDIFDTPITDLSPLSQTTSLILELGGSALQEALPLVGMENAKICLYKYPHEKVPKALESRQHQVEIRPIYKRHGE